MTPLRFVITGHPVAKARARVVVHDGKARGFTPAATRRWEADARQVARDVMKAQGRVPFTGPVTLTVTATFTVPVSKPRWWASGALAGRIAHTTKPDGDNVLKAAKDALNGIAWLDDAQVVAATVSKQYGEQPAVEIVVRRMPAVSAQHARREDVA